MKPYYKVYIGEAKLEVYSKHYRKLVYSKHYRNQLFKTSTILIYLFFIPDFLPVSDHYYNNNKKSTDISTE